MTECPGVPQSGCTQPSGRGLACSNSELGAQPRDAMQQVAGLLRRPDAAGDALAAEARRTLRRSSVAVEQYWFAIDDVEVIGTGPAGICVWLF